MIDRRSMTQALKMTPMEHRCLAQAKRPRLNSCGPADHHKGEQLYAERDGGNSSSISI